MTHSVTHPVIHSFTHSRSHPVTHLLFRDRPHLSAAVVAAVLADRVRELRLMALAAFLRADGLERVVGPALGGAGLGVASLWIRHRRQSLLNCFKTSRR